MPDQIDAPSADRILAIVIPVYNDWPALSILIQKLDDLAPTFEVAADLIIVNDGSPLPASPLWTQLPQHLSSIQLISLHCNLGHQRAIATGVSEAVRQNRYSRILVMDSDGEDAPEDIRCMLLAAASHPSSIIVAQRAKRSEGGVFRIFYYFYKFTFRCLTGHEIDFGNFCLLPAASAQRLAYMPDCWNHFSASIVKSKIALTRVPTARARRYSGKSSMNLISLVVHGFSAISVFSDAVLTRLFLGVGLLSLTAVGTGFVAVALRLFTDLAIPGWATNVFGLSVLLFLQSLTVLVLLIFSNLGHRSTLPFIPGLQSGTFIAQITTLWIRPPHANSRI